jgi:hypothetical protein
MALRRIPEASPVFPTPSDEDDVLGLGDEIQFGKRADLSSVDPGLFGVWKGLEGPKLGHLGAPDPPGECVFLARMPLGPEQAQEELVVGNVFGLRLFELLGVDLGDSSEAQVLEQLLEFFSHGSYFLRG